MQRRKAGRHVVLAAATLATLGAVQAPSLEDMVLSTTLHSGLFSEKFIQYARTIDFFIEGESEFGNGGIQQRIETDDGGHKDTITLYGSPADGEQDSIAPYVGRTSHELAHVYWNTLPNEDRTLFRDEIVRMAELYGAEVVRLQATGAVKTEDIDIGLSEAQVESFQRYLSLAPMYEELYGQYYDKLASGFTDRDLYVRFCMDYAFPGPEAFAYLMQHAILNVTETTNGLTVEFNMNRIPVPLRRFYAGFIHPVHFAL